MEQGGGVEQYHLKYKFCPILLCIIMRKLQKLKWFKPMKTYLHADIPTGITFKSFLNII